MFRGILMVEKLTIRLLVGMMLLTVVIATGELAYLLIKDLLAPPMDLLTISELLEVFGFFMLILIGIELMDTVKAYITENHVRGQSVIMVALIAIARKVIVLDPKQYTEGTLLAIAAIILALGLGYWLVRERNREGDAGKGPAPKAS
jgi:uncharacterized membrane protein (DUF373 family)